MSEPAKGPADARARTRVGWAVLVLAWCVLLVLVLHPRLLRRWLSDARTAVAAQADAPWVRSIDARDSGRKQIAIELQKVASGIAQPTDIQFPPGQDRQAIVLQKTGSACWLDVKSGEHGELFHVEVLTAIEEGLLGLAFHPHFKDNGRFFIDYVAAVDGKDMSRIAEWKLSGGDDLRHAHAAPMRVLLEVEQPYANHNAGQLAFGPDGYLYVGFGDGGAREDPHGNGQKPSTWLGKMLRIDVDADSAANEAPPRNAGAVPTNDPGKAYRVPRDNPFIGKPDFLPEIWALGLRNPWRYAFDPTGRLIIGDVGQDTWEELDIAQAGDNFGWNLKEGFVCYHGSESACARGDLVDPVFAYPRDDGNSTTGGYVYTGKRIAALRGLYVFGDFGSGRLFALELPRERKARIAQPIALGKWPFMPSAFGRDASGELYVASFARGEILRLSSSGAASEAH